ncbi:MAG: hypothetical protein EP344_10730 [Bacteroidetes bacterium]|nr:MAG: hypothetical protein EP344_10730 [Bacteroidota bacterium]
MKNLFFVIATVYSLAACQSKKLPEGSARWAKIQMNFSQIDSNGLAGSGNGKVAVNYEFCIPAHKRYWSQVRKIDTTAIRMPTATGRIGCSDEEWLIIGSTHQPGYLQVLYQLAGLAYIRKIEETYWE